MTILGYVLIGAAIIAGQWCIFNLGWLKRGELSIAADIMAEDMLSLDEAACRELSYLVSVEHPEFASEAMRDAAMKLTVNRRFIAKNKPHRFVKGGL